MSEHGPDALVVCIRVCMDPQPLAGSVVRACSRCKAEVWISAAGLRVAGEIVCDLCIGDLIPEITPVEIHPDCLRDFELWRDRN